MNIKCVEVLDALLIFALARQPCASVILVNLREEVLGPFAQTGQNLNLRRVECVAADSETREGEWLIDVI